MTELFIGGFGQVYSSLDKRGQSKSIQIRAHSSGCRHVLKLYNNETLAKMNPDALRVQVRWRLAMPVPEREELDSIAAVTRHTVRDSGHLVGVAIPVAPQRFWFESKSGESLPRDASRLCAGRGRMVEYFSLPFRYVFLGNFLNALLLLHDRGAVLGDVSLQNVLVGDDASCYLLDLDSAWLGLINAFGAIENERFAVAFEHVGFDQRTDFGKFAVVAIKVLGQDSALKTPASVHSILSAQHYRVLTRMWEGETVNLQVVRNMANDWIKCSGREFGLVYSTSSITRIAYAGDASIVSSASPVAVDICVPQERQRPGGLSWTLRIIILAVLAAVVWWFILR